MALQSVKGVISWPPETALGFSGYVGGTVTGYTIDAATEKVAFIFTVPIAGGNLTVTDIAFYVPAVTGSGDCDVRLETVGTDGNPTGTLAATNSNLVMTLSSSGVKVATLTASATLTAGTAYAVVFARSTGNYDIGSYRVEQGFRTSLSGAHMVYLRHFLAAAWSNSSTNPGETPIMGLKLSGGGYANLPGVCSFSAINRTQFNNTTTVRKRGSAFIPRFSGTVCGWSMWGGGFTAADFTMELRTPAGSLLASYAADKDKGNYYGGGGVNYSTFCRGYFDATVDITAGTTYDLLLVPGSATNIQVNTASIIVTGETNSIQALPGQADNIQVEIDNAAARTTDNTKWPLMSLLFSRLDDGAGGGGGGGMKRVGAGGLAG